jgi:hypothetical protein
VRAWRYLSEVLQVVQPSERKQRSNERDNHRLQAPPPVLPVGGTEDDEGRRNEARNRELKDVRLHAFVGLGHRRWPDQPCGDRDQCCEREGDKDDGTHTVDLLRAHVVQELIFDACAINFLPEWQSLENRVHPYAPAAGNEQRSDRPVLAPETPKAASNRSTSSWNTCSRPAQEVGVPDLSAPDLPHFIIAKDGRLTIGVWPPQLGRHNIILEYTIDPPRAFDEHLNVDPPSDPLERPARIGFNRDNKRGSIRRITAVLQLRLHSRHAARRPQSATAPRVFRLSRGADSGRRELLLRYRGVLDAECRSARRP